MDIKEKITNRYNTMTNNNEYKLEQYIAGQALATSDKHCEGSPQSELNYWAYRHMLCIVWPANTISSRFEERKMSEPG